MRYKLVKKILNQQKEFGKKTQIWINDSLSFYWKYCPKKLRPCVLIILVYEDCGIGRLPPVLLYIMNCRVPLLWLKEKYVLVQLEAACCKLQIHERTISLRFLDIILRVLRLEVSVYNVNITNQFQTTFALGGGVRGGGNFVVDCEQQGGNS